MGTTQDKNQVHVEMNELIIDKIKTNIVNKILFESRMELLEELEMRY